MKHATVPLLLATVAFQLISAQELQKQQMEARAARKRLRFLQETSTETETSSHGGAYSGATVHEILPDQEFGKIHTNWVPVEGEILQYCGMQSDTKCQQVKLSWVQRQHEGLLGVHKGYNSGEEIFKVKFWPPLPARLPAESPINKAGTDATALSAGWSNEDCVVTDQTLEHKWKAEAGQTHACQGLVLETEALFEYLHLPKFTGRAPLALGLVGFASLALFSSMVVAISRRVRARFGESATYTEALTREVLQAEATLE